MFANAGFRLSVCTLFLLLFFSVSAHALPTVTIGPFGPGTLDGTEPFDTFGSCASESDQLIQGEDCGESNGVVRTQDVVSHLWSVTADNYTPGQDNLMNVVLEQTITPSANGEVLFESIPVACTSIGGGGDTPPSAIVDNGDGSSTLTCNLGEFTEGAQQSVAVNVKISGNSHNDSDYTSNQRVYSLDNDGNPNATEGTSAQVGPIKISAAPAFDLVHSYSTTQSMRTGYIASRDVGNGSELGFYAYMQLRMVADRKTGIEAIQQPLVFKNEITAKANSETGPDYDLEFYVTECRDNPSSWSGENYGSKSYSPSYDGGSFKYHISDSGTCAYTRDDDADPTSTSFTVTISDADLSGVHYPTKLIGGADLSAGPYYVMNHRVRIWVPFRSIDLADGVQDDAGYVYLNSVLSDFDPNGVSGVSNYGAGTEPGHNGADIDGERGNNVIGGALELVVRGSVSKYNHRVVGDNGTSRTPFVEGESIVSHSGTAELEPGETFVGTIYFTNNGTKSLDNPMACDVFDNTTLQLTDRGNTGGTGGTYAYVGTSSTGELVPTNYIAEYAHFDLSGDDPLDSDGDGTRNYELSTGRYMGNWTKQRALRCNDGTPADGWFADPNAVPGGIDSVNAVRLRLTDAAQSAGVQLDPGNYIRFAIPLKARDQFNGGPYDGEQIPVGTVMPNYAGAKTDTWSADWTARSYTASPENGDRDGDRVTLTRIKLALDKESIYPEAAPGESATVLAGDKIVWKINNAVQSVLPNPSDAENLHIIDVLPPEATYDSACTAEQAGATPPNLVEYNTDKDGNPAAGYTRLSWNFGDVTANTIIPPRIFCTITDSLAMHGTDVENYAEIRADNVITPLEARSATHTIKLEQTGSIQISKKVDMPLDDMNDDQVYSLAWANFASSFTIDAPTIIDVLPFASGGGDGMGSMSERTPESDFNGKLELTAAPVTKWLDGSVPDTGAGDPHAELGTWYYSADAPQTINYDPDMNAAEGTTNWCPESDFNTGACPVDFAAVTALKFVSNYALEKDGDPRQGMRAEFTLQAGDPAEPNGENANLPGDIYTNRFTFDSTSLPADQFLRSNNVSVEVAAFSIGDLIFADVNGNGKYDAGTDGVVPDGVTVELYQVADDDSESKIRETTTGIVGPGRYLFEPLASGNYYVKIPATEFQPGGKLEGWSEAPPTGTNRENNDENEHIDQHGYSETTPQALGIRTDAVELSANSPPPGGVPTGNEPTGDNVLPITDPTGDDFSNLTLDIGLDSPLSSLGNVVWIDQNNNGLQDPDESGLTNVTVRLLDAEGNALQTTRTDYDGYYSFTGLVAADYIVEVVKPVGYEFGPKDAVTDDTADSDVDMTTGRTDPITLAFGQHDTQWDAGLYPLGSIGDRVWIDSNANGLQNIEEADGIEGVNVTLLNADGDPVATAITGEDGEYLFVDLPPATYTVDVDAVNPALDGYNLTTANDPYEVGLAAGQDYRDADFGYVNYASVGDTVWHDLNGDGVQDAAGEPGVAGVAVRLLESGSGTIVQSTTTGAAGDYLFEDVIPGDYVIEFVQPNDYTGFVGNDLGGDDTLDSDAVGSSGKTGTFALAAGENRTDIDAGLYKSATLGNLLWLDEDGDAAQDAEEPGLPGTQVTLTGMLGDGSAFTSVSVVTDENGHYQFGDLYPGDYTVTFDDAGFVTADQGGDDALDSDVAPNGTAMVTLASGDNNQSIDAGIAAAAVTGRVWIDNNTEDAIDSGTANEEGVVGVTANLIDAATGDVVATTTTGVDGVYTFSGVKPGNYLVEIVEPANMGFVTQDQGGDDTSDSDVNTATGRSEPFALAAAQTVTDVDAGIEPGSLGDHVTLDMNNNGIQDAGEPGVEGIKVFLLDGDDNEVASTETDPTGFYDFSGVAPGNYTVHFELPNDMKFAKQDEGSNDTIDFDTNEQGDVSVAVISGEGNQTIDAGITPATLGDTVWFDTDGNGLQDEGEPGVAGITVTLLDGNHEPVKDAGGNPVTTITDELGEYQFSVLPGEYGVGFTLPEGMSFTKQGGGDNHKDSDADENGQTATTRLASDESDLNLDAGIAPALIMGSVLLDANGNGTEEAGDTGMPDVVVTLTGTDVLGNPVEMTTKTEDDGSYEFVVMPGEYEITETNPNNMTSSGAEAGTVGSTVVNDDKLEVMLNSGEVSAENDFLDYEAASLSGQVREDSNADGDTGEAADSGIAGVEVILWQDTNADGTPDSVFANTTTNPNGEYSFLDIPPGSYVVIESDLTVYTSTADTDGVNDNRIAVTLASGESSPDHDFLDTRPANISGQVRDDIDRDGDTNDTEPGLPGLTISLYTDPDGDGDPTDGALVTKTTTSVQGEYQFNNVLPGNYVVVEGDPEDYESTADQDGENDNRISVALISGTANTGNDFLDTSVLGSLSGTVWMDANPDGTLEQPAETGIPGVVVLVQNESGVTIATLVTNGDGYYEAKELPAGMATVMIDLSSLPPDMVQTGDPDAELNHSTRALVVAGEHTPDLDFGYVGTASVGDKVWEDLNGNGIQDDGEPGVKNIAVVLSKDGAQIATVATDSEGGYLFSGLLPGDYEISFELPQDYYLTAANQGDNDTLDSDAGMDDGKVSVSLVPGEEVGVDAGLYRHGALGDTVWLDMNNNGVQDEGEPAISEMVVNLLNAAGDPQLDDLGQAISMQTNELGQYLFTGLRPADYLVEFVAPAGISFTSADQGLDDALDSDAQANGQAPARVVSAQTNRSVDAGIVPAAVSGRVWIDNNTPNNLDEGMAIENGVVGVVVNLIDADSDAVVATTTTGPDGVYNFIGIGPGDYLVQVTQPANMGFVDPDVGSDDTVDSDVDESNGRSAVFILTSGSVVTDLDAGIEPGALGDHVFLDENQNGLQDSGEPGVASVTVKLINGDGNVVDTQVTDATGFYNFAAQLPGEYTVEFTLPDGMHFTEQNVGSNDTLDSDPDADGKAVVTVSSGVGDQNLDAGVVPAMIGDMVWMDTDGDGTQGGSEPVMANVMVTLLDDKGEPVLDNGGNAVTTMTDATGYYQFVVEPGTYAVQFTLPEGAAFTTQDSGSDDEADSDADLVSGETISVTVASGDNNGSLDAGVQPATISGSVLQDNNGDGAESDGDTPLKDVTITLEGTDVFGNPVARTMTTDESGEYAFDVPPGTYIITETNPEDFVSSGVETGPDGAVINTVINNDRVEITVMSGETAEGNDFLDYQPASINGQVREDVNGDADTTDNSDPALGGVNLLLWRDTDGDGTADVVVTNATTDEKGNYTFNDLPPGDYMVIESDPVAYQSIADTSGANDNLIALTLVSAEDSVGHDFLDARPTMISGLVTEDSNRNGVQDDGKSGLADVVVTLFTDPNGDGNPEDGTPVAVAETDDDGNYAFADVLPGNYVLVETDPDLYDSTGDSSGDPTDNLIPVTSVSGENNTGNTFLDTKVLGSVSGVVWEDSDADGAQDNNEPLLKGMTVHLLDKNGNILATTTTGSLGEYRFIDQVPGDYTVWIPESSLPSGYKQTSDPDQVLDSRHGLTIYAKTDHSAINFGYAAVSSLGDRVWLDRNNNGVQDGDEPGVPGVTVYLLDKGGLTIATTTTDENGYYGFHQVMPGDYTLRFERPQDVNFVARDAGSNDALDSDVDGNGAVNVTIQSGKAGNQSIDAGIVPGVIRGQVIEDNNADGLIDAKDTPIAGVTLIISGTDSYGNPVSMTVVTNDKGEYEAVLPPGTYTVTEIQPDGYQSSGSIPPATNGSSVKSENELLIKLGSDWVADNSSFLNYQPGMISGTLMTDPNGDGDTSDGRPRSGVTVQLFTDPNGDGDTSDGKLVGTALTGADGGYSFGDLAPGDYVLVRKSTDGGDKDDEISLKLESGEQTDVELGPVDSGSVSLSGAVQEDSNNDGKLDDNDKGVPGVIVTLHTDPDSDGNENDGKVVIVTTTNGNGEFEFENVEPGSYVVVETDPFGFVSLSDSSGINDNRVPVVLVSGYKPLGISFLDKRDDDTPPPVVGGDNVQIPTLTEWALIMLSMLMLLVAAARIRQH